ncbi:protein spinster homolog 1 [Eurytemora carolleeae]|uniref:protein spinster homolog 1 n=1 Tax=Eurytemora carolleeae TaxID=1294199 RepID=UPI000C791ECA|nr:protein spinster homolog 1 [Eurytemora carolleeae]|eukprot:XP_023322348.1 protein spinster homolog 1-like [Eurytemora affinis]
MDATSQGWTLSKALFLSYMALSYVIGEIAHFLINTTSREVAREIQFGDQACFVNKTRAAELNSNASCTGYNETSCTEEPLCYWEYSGLGYEYQILAGPAFIGVFTVSAMLLAVLSDFLYDKLSRTVLLAAGTFTFSSACILMGLASQYWHLVILRGLIAMGESVCRPISGALIAELFPPSSRGVANGIFSWGVYYGYGLAYVFGIYITEADIAGYGWRAPYVLAGIPGLLISVLLCFAVKDPRCSQVGESKQGSRSGGGLPYFKSLLRNFLSPSMIILLLAAFARHTAGLAWAYNTRLFFQTYYPDFDIVLWILCASVIGGSFGVFAGGFFSDRLVKHLGLPSRLWLLALCTLLAAPLAVGTLYFPPPQAMYCLIAYYFLAETWFAVLFTVIVEIVDPEVRSTCIAIFLFCMNQVGGNLPIVVTPLSKTLGYRTAMYVMWPGSLTISSVLFLTASLPLIIRQRRMRNELMNEPASDEKSD